jgi:hypothetical protein
LVHEPIVNEPSEIKETPEQDNIDVEEEPIPSQEFQEAVPLRRSTRERRSAISNYYIVFLRENEFNIGMMEDDPVTGLRIVDTIKLPLKLYCDNSSAVLYSNDDRSSLKSKHIDIKFLAVKERVQSGLISI